MKIADIKVNDIIVHVSEYGASYFKVLKINRVTIDVKDEHGRTIRAYPNIFERKVTYRVPAFAAATVGQCP